MSSTAASRSRRPRNRSRSRVASSAQWTSSTTTHVQRAGLADLAQQRAEQLLAVGAGPAQLEQLAAELVGEVEQRPERARGEQAVAGPPRPAGVRAAPGCSRSTSADLPDARLAADQDQPSLAAPRPRAAYSASGASGGSRSSSGVAVSAAAGRADRSGLPGPDRPGG